MKRIITHCLFTVGGKKGKVEGDDVPSERTLDFIRRFARDYKPESEDGVGHFLFKEGKGYYFTDIFHVMEA